MPTKQPCLLLLVTLVPSVSSPPLPCFGVCDTSYRSSPRLSSSSDVSVLCAPSPSPIQQGLRGVTSWARVIVQAAPVPALG